MDHIRKAVAMFVIAAALGLGINVVTAVVSPQPAQAAGPCNLIPDPVLQILCEKAGSALPNLPLPGPSGLSSGIGGVILAPILQQAVKAEAEAVGFVLQKMLEFLITGTVPDTTQPWFLKVYAMVFGFATLLAVAGFYARLTEGVKNQDPTALPGALVSFLTFFLVGGTLPFLVKNVVQVADGPVTKSLLDSVTNTKQVLITLTTDLSAVDITTAIAIPAVILLIGVLGGVVVLLELFFRLGAVYVFTIAEVVALAAWVSGRLGGDMPKRISFSLLGLVFFKVIMAIILMVGLGLLGSDLGKGRDSFEPIILGTVVCLLVPFLSWHAYKLIAGHNPRPVMWANRSWMALKSLVPK